MLCLSARCRLPAVSPKPTSQRTIRTLLSFLLIAVLAAACSASSPLQKVHGDVVLSRIYGGTGVSYDSRSNLLIETSGPSAGMGPSVTTVSAIRIPSGALAWRTAVHMPASYTNVISEGDYTLIATTPAVVLTGTPTPMYLLDMATGKVIRSVDLNAQDLVIGFAGSNVLVVSESGVVSSVSARTGLTAWRWHAPCTVEASFANSKPVASNDIVALGMDCRNADRSYTSIVVALRATTGSVAWRRAVPGGLGGPGQVLHVSQGFVEFSSPTRVVLVAPDGHVLLSEPIYDHSYPAFAADGSRLLVVYQRPDRLYSVNLLSAQSGRIVKTAVAAENFTSISAFLQGKVAEVVGALPGPLLPAVLLQLNLADNSRAASTLPLPGADVRSALFGSGPSYFMAGHTLLASGDAGTEALSLTPPSGMGSAAGRSPELQGSVPRWPNVCALLPKRELVSLLGRHYTAIGRDAPPVAGLPGAHTCQVVAAPPVQLTLYVQIEWDSTSSTLATALFRAAYLAHCRVPGPWIQSCYAGPADPLPDDFHFLADRLIVHVYDTSSRPISVRFSSALARHLSVLTNAEGP